MFTPDDLSGKAVCKKALQEQFGLKQDPDVPLFATISRFAEQKGLDVFARGLEYLAQNFDMQFVVIGSGDMYLENWFRYLAGKFPGKIGVYIGYASQATAHLAEAGADFFVMPSRYEPCGLNQMYSMRYGTLPIVRSTGGLADTVINLTDEGARDRVRVLGPELHGAEQHDHLGGGRPQGQARRLQEDDPPRHDHGFLLEPHRRKLRADVRRCAPVISTTNCPRN